MNATKLEQDLALQDERCESTKKASVLHDALHHKNVKCAARTHMMTREQHERLNRRGHTTQHRWHRCGAKIEASPREQSIEGADHNDTITRTRYQADFATTYFSQQPGMICKAINEPFSYLST